MKIISFRLWGEAAMWRHPSEALGHLSGAGPSPSQIAGILGASLGFRTESLNLKNGRSFEAKRPNSPKLLAWLETAEVKVAARVTNPVRRIGTSTNGFKTLQSFQTFRIQRKSIDLPNYEILVTLNSEGEGERLLTALRTPHYPIYLGDSNHPGKITGAGWGETTPNNWAFQSDALENEEYVWNTKMSKEPTTRLVRTGYWNYPDPQTGKEREPEFQTCLL